MRIQKIAYGLTVVDVETFANEVFRGYYHDLTHTYGFEIADKDSDKLLLYHTLSNLISLLKEQDNRKNVIFYINASVHIEARFLKAFVKICKVFPVLHYTNTLDYNCLDQNSGCCEELSTLIKECRYSFDFNKYPQRKMNAFLEKYKIKLAFPA